MKTFFLFYLLANILDNPLAALLLVFGLYYLSDHYYFGFMPDIPLALRRLFRLRELLRRHQINPADANASHDIGVIYFERKNYREALRYFSQAAEKMRGEASLDCYLGICETELGNTDRGRQLLEAAVGQNPKVAYGLPRIYLLRDALARHQDAAVIARLEQTLRSSASVEILYRMGLVFLRAGDRGKAKACFSEAIQDYAHCPRGLRRLHRKWWLLAWLRRLCA